ncbi:MAG: hypothetical protein OEZ59_07020 [Deltaproteobacteria bacterium]|nr:hypothetical protein [Deltaproteobacteria bacterium]
MAKIISTHGRTAPGRCLTHSPWYRRRPAQFISAWPPKEKRQADMRHFGYAPDISVIMGSSWSCPVQDRGFPALKKRRYKYFSNILLFFLLSLYIPGQKLELGKEINGFVP